MIGFFGLAMAGIFPNREREDWQQPPSAYADFLGDYYLANGRSWNGIETRLGGIGGGATNWLSYTIVDDRQIIVVSTSPRYLKGEQIDPQLADTRWPIVARGERVGWLLLGPPGQRFRQSGPTSFLISFASAGGALAVILIVGAALFTRWVTRPLRRITSGAGQLARGQLDVSVQGASVRELDDLANAFNSMAADLAAADAQRRQLTADVAHELRTPLSIIKGRLEGIQDGVYTADQTQIAGLLDETSLLERLIEDLRLLALADAGQLPLYPEPTDIAPLLQTIAASFAAQAAAHQIGLTVDVPAALPEIQADSQRLTQVISNLMTNALRHTPPGGQVTIAAEVGDGHLTIAVRDTGSGIPAADLPHIFDRFWRADKARSRGGSGLGLAIAREIVQRHGGTIAARSTPQLGTTMHVMLPLG